MVTNKATAAATKSRQRDANDGPLLDSINAAVKKMVAFEKCEARRSSSAAHAE